MVLVSHDPVVAAHTRRVVVLHDGVIDGDLRRSDNHSDADWAAQLAGWLTSHGT